MERPANVVTILTFYMAMGQNLRYLFCRDCHLFKRLLRVTGGTGVLTHCHISLLQTVLHLQPMLWPRKSKEVHLLLRTLSCSRMSARWCSRMSARWGWLRSPTLFFFLIFRTWLLLYVIVAYTVCYFMFFS